MSTVATERRWFVIDKSVSGASHVRSGLPNQDAVKVDLSDGDGLPAVLAISDGHGSAKCFRSHEGSRMAVESAVAILREFVDSIMGLEPPEVRQIAERDLPRNLVKRWRSAVEAHYQEHPFRDEELSQLDDAAQTVTRDVHDKNKAFLAYGATLVTALVCPSYIIYLQLGDGEILSISGQSGEVEQPLEVDDNLIANETTSLCQEEAWKKFRFRFQFLHGQHPALILLATDGYPNSFQSPEGFRQVAYDLLNLLDKDGIEQVGVALPGWLDEASKSGSGDDVSVAILYSSASGPRPIPMPKTPPSEIESPRVGPTLIDRATRLFLSLYLAVRRWFRRHPDWAIASTLLLAVLVVAQILSWGLR